MSGKCAVSSRAVKTGVLHPGYFSVPSPADGKLASPNAAMHRACRIAGIPPVTVHGLRRSFGSLAEWTETPTGIVAQVMGHKPSATEHR